MRRGQTRVALDFPAAARERLLEWFGEHGRRLPWREEGAGPYGVLVSEFMLQQTTVAAVAPFYERWMRRFPNVESLAAATEEEVLGAWQGLGYYSRARRLHEVARRLCRGGVVEWPSSYEGWKELPGIGDYTAGAVMAFAFNRPAPVVDANVARVLARWGGFCEPLETAAGRRWLRETAGGLQPAEDSGLARAWNSAVMELGALVCRAARAECLLCPVRGWCAAFRLAEGPERIPVLRERPKVTEVTEHRQLCFSADGRCFLAEISGGPRWKGLHVLPLCGERVEAPLLEIIHAITRFRVRLKVHLGGASGGAPGREGSDGKERGGEGNGGSVCWVPVAEWEERAWAAPHRRAIARALQLLHTGRHDGCPNRS